MCWFVMFCFWGFGAVYFAATVFWVLEVAEFG